MFLQTTTGRTNPIQDFGSEGSRNERRCVDMLLPLNNPIRGYKPEEVVEPCIRNRVTKVTWNLQLYTQKLTPDQKKVYIQCVALIMNGIVSIKNSIIN